MDVLVAEQEPELLNLAAGVIERQLRPVHDGNSRFTVSCSELAFLLNMPNFGSDIRMNVCVASAPAHASPRAIAALSWLQPIVLAQRTRAREVLARPHQLGNLPHVP